MDHGQEVRVGIENILLFEGNIPSICKKTAMKKKLLVKKNEKDIFYLS